MHHRNGLHDAEGLFGFLCAWHKDKKVEATTEIAAHIININQKSSC